MQRTTISFDPDLYRALRAKASASGRTFSELVNEAVELYLMEDAEDLEVFEEREHEPVVDFEVFRRGGGDSGRLA